MIASVMNLQLPKKFGKVQLSFLPGIKKPVNTSTTLFSFPCVQQKSSFSCKSCSLQQQRPEVESNGNGDRIDQTENRLFRDVGEKSSRRRKHSFGFMFDIDGVLVRGRHVIPPAKLAIRKVLESNIPTIFLTNGSCETEEHKAKVLSTQLHFQVNADQIVLSHSPLRKLENLHDKHIVVSGQGPLSEIAKSCGFKHISTVEQISEACPLLDVNDRRKRFHIPPMRCHDMMKAEGIVLMGEPIHWETHLQVLIDLLITNGMPNECLKSIPERNLPIIAVNPDLLWMSEATNPRFGNGAFLCCLESLYKKLTGKDLEYTSVLGKPNLFTYKFAAEALRAQAKQLNGAETMIERIYAIGDNIDTDIYGANTYKRYLRKPEGKRTLCKEDEFTNTGWKSNEVSEIQSILVRTGVSAVEKSLPQKGINHLHRDTLYDPEMTMPDYIVEDVLEAVDVVFHKEEMYY